MLSRSPCRRNAQQDAWDGTYRPAGHVCASGEATFGLAHCIPASTDACPPSLGWGHVCGAAGFPNPCPALADGQCWAHPSPLPAFLGDQGTMVRVSVLEGTASFSLPHISLPHRIHLKDGRSQREQGAGGAGGWAGELCWQCQQICWMGGPLQLAARPGGRVLPWASLAPALCQFPRSSPGPAQSPR